MSKHFQYLIPSLFVLLWWNYAFIHVKVHDSNPRDTRHSKRTSFIQTPHVKLLSSFSKEQIHQALSGDIPLMAKLIREWDIDAQILKNQGLSAIQRLPRRSFLRAQIIERKLNETGSQGADENQNAVVYDDQGVPFPVNNQFKRYLPQTFVAASFLFALTTPDQIVGLPSGLRAQTSLYPTELTNQIPLNTDRMYSEHLYRKEPDIAFVADYSHPATIEMLRNQGIPLFSLNGMKTVTQIKNAIRRIGDVVSHSLKAELLVLFIESAMIAIDNRLKALKHDLALENLNPKIMFLNHFSQFSAPTQRTITGCLLRRLEQLEFHIVPRQLENTKYWSIPIEQESIINDNPDFLIVATHNQEELLKQITSHPAFVNLNACRYQQVYMVDNTPHAPTQFIVLAYLDIAQALLKTHPVVSGINPNLNPLCVSD